MPVYEGFAMPSSIRRIDVAGRDVTEHLQVLLRKSGTIFHTSAEKEVVRIMKEKTAYVSVDPKREEKDWAGGGATGKVENYTLPDGSILKLGAERFRAPELLFDPEIIGLEYPGIHQIVVDAINRTDLDLRKALYGNIVLSGGSTLTKGTFWLFHVLRAGNCLQCIPVFFFSFFRPSISRHSISRPPVDLISQISETF